MLTLRWLSGLMNIQAVTSAAVGHCKEHLMLEVRRSRLSGRHVLQTHTHHVILSLLQVSVWTESWTSRSWDYIWLWTSIVHGALHLLHESHSSDRSSTEKDNHKFQELFVVIHLLADHLQDACWHNRWCLALCLPLDLPHHQLQSLVHTWPCLWIPSIAEIVWRVAPREKMWLPYTPGTLHQLSVP